MIEIALNEVCKYYGANPILKGATLEVRQGERLALLGENGSGKSTLFKIIAGIENLDGGVRNLRRGASLGYLQQIPSYAEDATVQSILYSSFQETMAVRDEMARIEKRMAEAAVSPDLLEKYGKLQHLFENQGGYAMEDLVNRVCQGLKIPSEWHQRKFAGLSGGEQSRVQLAKLMLESPEILLLDEPTNHLDANSLEWLEDFLADYPGTVLVISHDRFFLDRIVGRVAELADGKIENYAGNFSAYRREKALRKEALLKRYEDEQQKIKRLESSAKRLHEWARNGDNPKMHRQAFNIEKRIERMEKIDKPTETRRVKKGFVQAAFSGQEVLTARHIGKVFHGETVLQDIDLTVRSKERIGILGENGSGKTTLLRIMTGEIAPDRGELKIGESIRWAYLPQIVTFSNPSATVLETLGLEIPEHETGLRRWLARFNFFAEDVHKRVGDLSGGEKTRLKLCMLMHRELNLLILDEPTNHLDIDSREWLEEVLADFDGAVIFVSHDRYFINRFATRIAELSHGAAVCYNGDYQSYLARKHAPPLPEAKKIEQRPANEIRKNPSPIKPAVTDRLETEIMEWENRLAEIHAEMAHYSDDYDQLSSLLPELEKAKTMIQRLYEEWSATIS